jgi:Tissue inhibitor of metalloproteinase
MSKIVTLLFLAAALLVCTPSTIRACSCDDFPSHQKEFKSSKAVFVGKVLAIEKQLPIPEALSGQVPEVAYAVRLEIERSWKGSKTGKVVVWLHTSSLVCSRWEFRPNERYLIYGREYKHILIVQTWCSRTRPLERNDEESIREYKELDSMRAKKSDL